MRTVAINVFLGLWVSLAFAQQEDAQKILEKMDAQNYGYDDQIMELRYTIKDVDGSEKVYDFVIYQKGTNKRLVRFTSGEVKGMATLVDGPSRMFVYLPGYNKVRRVASHAMNQTFAGSDFTMDDISNPTFSPRYNAKILREDDSYWYLELVPKEGQNPLYPKVHIAVQKGTYWQGETTYFDASGAKVKVMTVSEPKDFGGLKRNSVIVLKDVRTGHSTRLDVLSFKVNQGLKDSMFTERELIWER
jgi:outer membrane lipoprotein-sorting protein